MNKLNWGSGPVVAPGWTNSDIGGYGQEHCGDILEGLPWPDGHFDGIVANHSLQALPAGELDHALREFHRVLRPGGHLRVLVPNVVAAFLAWQREDDQWAGYRAIAEPWGLDRKFCHYLTWGGQNRSCFTREVLGMLLMRNGFALYSGPFDVEWLWLSDLDSRLDESLVIEAVA